MLPTAHIASALIVQRIAGKDANPGMAIAGALLPDAIDKTLAWVLKVTPSGRHIGHTPLAAGVASLGASAMLGREAGRALGLSYLVHLAGDLWHGGHVPWLMPLKRYDLRSQPWRADLSLRTLLLEACAAAVVVQLLRTPQSTES